MVNIVYLQKHSVRCVLQLHRFCEFSQNFTLKHLWQSSYSEQQQAKSLMPMPCQIYARPQSILKIYWRTKEVLANFGCIKFSEAPKLHFPTIQMPKNQKNFLLAPIVVVPFRDIDSSESQGALFSLAGHLLLILDQGLWLDLNRSSKFVLSHFKQVWSGTQSDVNGKSA